MTRLWRGIECNWALRSIVAVMFGIILGFSGNLLINRLTQDTRPPVHFTKVEALNSPVPRGGVLEVRITRDKFRSDCTVKSERYATNRDGVVFELPDLTWKGGPAATEYFDYGYDVSALPVGQYILHVELTYFCDGGTRVFPVTQPNVNFRISHGG